MSRLPIMLARTLAVLLVAATVFNGEAGPRAQAETASPTFWPIFCNAGGSDFHRFRLASHQGRTYVELSGLTMADRGVYPNWPSTTVFRPPAEGTCGWRYRGARPGEVSVKRMIIEVKDCAPTWITGPHGPQWEVAPGPFEQIFERFLGGDEFTPRVYRTILPVGHPFYRTVPATALVVGDPNNVLIVDSACPKSVGAPVSVSVQ